MIIYTSKLSSLFCVRYCNAWVCIQSVYVLVNKYMYYWIDTCIHETNTCMTIHVLGQYLKHNTCIVLQYMYCVTNPQCVPSFRLECWRCVMLQDEDVKGWKVRRNIDGIDRADFTLDVVLAPGSKFRVGEYFAQWYWNLIIFANVSYFRFSRFINIIYSFVGYCFDVSASHWRRRLRNVGVPKMFSLLVSSRMSQPTYMVHPSLYLYLCPSLWHSGIGCRLGRNRLWFRFLAVSDIYPMFIEPTITWVSSGFSGYIWLDTKIVFKKIDFLAQRGPNISGGPGPPIPPSRGHWG